MHRLASIAIVFALLLQVSPKNAVEIHIPTSQVVSVAQIIARDEGYDIQNQDVYYFDLLTTSEGKPLLPNYISVGFYINGNVRSTISINDATGQAADATTCELFDFPDLKPFQDKMIRLSKAKPMSPGELATDIGCKSLKILTAPISRSAR
ncbi:MAG: hypothetical protein WBG02_05595 [Candidatus Acidiferrum sp.]